MSPSSHAGFPFSRTLARHWHITELFVHTRQPNAHTCQLKTLDIYGAGATTCPPSTPKCSNRPSLQPEKKGRVKDRRPLLATIFTTHINVWCSDCLQVYRTKSRPPKIECTSCISVMQRDETPFYQQLLKKKRGTPAREKLNKGRGLTDRSSCYGNEHIQRRLETKLVYSQLSQQFPIPSGHRLSVRIQK